VTNDTRPRADSHRIIDHLAADVDQPARPAGNG
jgi:hypothetical protein